MNLKKNNTQDFIDRLKGIKEPRDGKRVSTGYLNKAVKAITRIGNLSNKTNYKYEESQVTEIFHTLMSAVTVTISRFGVDVDNVENRFQRLIDWDLKQYLELKKSDPLLYDYIQDHLNNPVIEEYLKEKEKGKAEDVEVLSIQQKLSSSLEKQEELVKNLYHSMNGIHQEISRISREIHDKQEYMAERLDRVILEFNLLED